MRLEEIGKLKKPNEIIWTPSRHLPACSPSKEAYGLCINKTKLRGLSLQAKYTVRPTAACQ
jgi:hypothetical protein